MKALTIGSAADYTLCMATREKRVLALCGPLKQSSSNLMLLQKLAEFAPVDFQFSIFESLERVPLFNPDLLEGQLSQPLLEFKNALNDADFVVIACPEYGHSLPGVLKNAIDWTIGSGEFNRKRVAITAAVRDKRRGLRGLGALHQTLSAVDALIVFADTIEVSENVEEQMLLLFEALNEA